MRPLYAPSRPCFAVQCYFFHLYEILRKGIAVIAPEACPLSVSQPFVRHLWKQALPRHLPKLAMKKPTSTSLSGSGGKEEGEIACYFLAPVQARKSRLPPQPGNSSAKKQCCLLSQPLFDLLGSTEERPIRDTTFQSEGWLYLLIPSNPFLMKLFSL